MMLIRVLSLSLLLTAAAARADAGVAEERVIVSGKGVRVTVADVQAALSTQSPRLRERYQDPAALRELVNELVRQQLLFAEAEERGYERDRAVAHNVKDSSAQALVRREIDEKVTPESVPDEEVAAYYESHSAEFHRPAMRRVSVIVFDSEDEAKRVLPQALEGDARTFASLAREHSREPKSKAEAGDLGYFTREPSSQEGERAPIPDAVRAAAFALKEIGDTSPQPVPFGQQFALVRMSGERPVRDISLADASPSIRTKLWRERRQKALDALVASLRARDKPKVFTDRIYRIDFDDMERRPSGFQPDPAPRAKTKP